MKKTIILIFCIAAALGAVRAEPADVDEATQESSRQASQQRSDAATEDLEASVGLRDVEADFKPPSGYKQKSLNGKTVYCKKERISGTRFLKTYCFTQLQLRARELRDAEMRRDVARFQVERGSK